MRLSCLPSTTFLVALGGLLGLRRLPHDESGSTVNMQGSARGRTFSGPCRPRLLTPQNPWRQFLAQSTNSTLFPLLSSLCSLSSSLAAAVSDRTSHPPFWLTRLHRLTRLTRLTRPHAESSRRPLLQATTRPLGHSTHSTLFPLLSSLCSLPSSLAAAHVSDRNSHMPLRTLHQTIESAPRKICEASRIGGWPSHQTNLQPAR